MSLHIMLLKNALLVFAEMGIMAIADTIGFHPVSCFVMAILVYFYGHKPLDSWLRDLSHVEKDKK